MPFKLSLVQADDDNDSAENSSDILADGRQLSSVVDDPATTISDTTRKEPDPSAPVLTSASASGVDPHSSKPNKASLCACCQ